MDDSNLERRQFISKSYLKRIKCMRKRLFILVSALLLCSAVTGIFYYLHSTHHLISECIQENKELNNQVVSIRSTFLFTSQI